MLHDTRLLFQKRFRGLLPLSPHAASDDGSVTFVRPDELEARAYQVARAQGDGRVTVLSSFSVEKVRALAMAADGVTLLGATDDDAYLFRDGRKSRLMPGRRLSYSAVALDAGGARFAVAFADMMFSTHTIALGDTGGKIAWTRELPLTLTAVALDGEGRHLAVGSQEGRLRVLNASRELLFEHAIDEPITAIALAGNGTPVIVGTSAGTLASIEADGGRAWALSVGRPIVAVAVDAGGALAAAVAAEDADGVLAVVDATGDLLWEHALDARPVGLSLSPDGSHLALSLSDGRLLLFSLGHASGVTLAGGAPLFAPARAAWESGDRDEARALARRALAADPADLDACDALIAWEAELVAEHVARAEALAVAGDPAALAELEAAAGIDATDARLIDARPRIHARLAEALFGEADAAPEPETACAAWEAVLRVDFKHREARRRLGEARSAARDALIATGEASADAGEVAAALDALRRARELGADEALSARIRGLEVLHLVAEGRRLYDARRYPEAIFQLQKALSLEPGHEEARRYLEYARGLSADSSVSARFQKLE